eukprot:CAMPEP_0117064042 /NCGR_PEP_ID=MMETSP0472-20121206/44712_1 /TAXON_ID=693140 ORGANISM="Tiarina fusus, Strain LIS" /NCGR_SAMPLE_ID=MMETSP0472 /ASSEMBLY_ACC=CAM_ASM_000603 /LENGTH=829 /DNA_ID=CAMNT_0004783995 /DNA_START=45 /DNA_END=2532 /DNA_ORIENTATION=+
MMGYNMFLHATFVVFWLLVAKSSVALPSGFVDEGFANVNAPTGFSFAPKLSGEGYMMLVCEKGGRVWVLPNPDESDDEINSLDIRDRTCTNQERGVQSVVAHPDFPMDRRVYVFYAFPKFGNCDNSAENGPVNRVSVFLMTDDLLLDPDSEEVILETSSLFNKIHNGGDMQFGKDGHLYISLGEAGDRRTNGQALNRLLGSMIRITADGGIPSDNPYTAEKGFANSARCVETGMAPSGSPADAVCEEIVAKGLRNPFRFAMDPNTPDGVVRLFFNDVGGNSWEETNELVIGGNFGWPLREGPCELDSTTSCEPTGDEYLDQDDGGAAVGCAFVPNGLWPAEYDDAFLYMDFVFGEIYVLREDPSLYCRTCNPPTPGWEKTVFHRWEWPVTLKFGPYLGGQALYYSVRGVGYNNIRRIYFAGGDNDAPVAVLEADQTQALVGATIEFDGSSSNDPNFDEITYNWDFGDGTTIEDGEAVVNHAFSSLGEFVVSLTVTDASGFSDIAYIEITVGDKPTLVGSAVDSFGVSIPEESFTWEVRQHHNTHYHPFLDLTQGNNIVIAPAPPPEDFLAATNSYLEIILTVSDANGVSETLSRIVMPKMVTLEFDTEPSGLELLLDDYTVTTPIEVVSWENHQLQAEAYDQVPWLWMSWSDDGSRRHAISVPAQGGATVGQDAFDYRYVAFFAMTPSEQPSAQASEGPTLQPSPQTSLQPTSSGQPTSSQTTKPSSEPVTTPAPNTVAATVESTTSPSETPSSSGGLVFHRTANVVSLAVGCMFSFVRPRAEQKIDEFSCDQGYLARSGINDNVFQGGGDQPAGSNEAFFYCCSVFKA